MLTVQIDDSCQTHFMRPFTPHYLRQLNYTFSNTVKTAARSQVSRTAIRTMASDHGELKIENTNIKTADGVDLSSQQKTLVGSVLDLFAGRPSLTKLDLWKDDAVFRDPIATATGRKEFAPQWYVLPFLPDRCPRSSLPHTPP